MGQISRAFTYQQGFAALLVALLSTLSAQQAALADDSLEREQLAALQRQLELTDRLVANAAATAPQARSRYHFDYDRLGADLNRVRAGIQDYLEPQRAQPRDPAPLTGDYTRSNPPEATSK